MVDYKVIFHLDENDPQRIKLVLNNLNNLMQDMGEENLELELVTYGPGLQLFLKASPFFPHMESLAEKGVIFAACNNTIKGMGIAVSELLDSVQVVPSGVGELVKKQHQGWIYIRP
ncbi:DsrE family protein [Methanobacterium movens]